MIMMTSLLLAGECRRTCSLLERTQEDLARHDDEEDAPNSLQRAGLAAKYKGSGLHLAGARRDIAEGTLAAALVLL
jgi:hypothetical protein